MKLNPAASIDADHAMFLSKLDPTYEKTFSLRFSSDHFSWIDIGTPNESVVGD